MRGFYPGAKILKWIPIPSPMKKPEKKLPKNSCPWHGILVGTEMIFSHICRPVDRVVAISVDGLFTLPEFKMNEKVFLLLLKLKYLAKKLS